MGGQPFPGREEKGAEGMRRREFLATTTLAGTAGLLGLRPDRADAEPPPETTRIRLYTNRVAGAAGCSAPRYVAQEFLKGEGFTDVQYVLLARAEADRALAAGDIDMNVGFIGTLILQIDRDPVTVLAGIHVGCFELFAHEPIRTVRDLKGKTVGVTEAGTGRHVFLASLLAYVGLDIRRDVNLSQHPPAEARRLFAQGKLDAYQAFAEDVYELRDQKIGRVLLNTTTERPWSQYFCCMLAANREFVRKHPVATKRAVRAMLKASDVCGLEPERAARFLREGGYVKPELYDPTLRLLKDLPYAKWRQSDPEDTVRFYSLRLREAGMIRSDPKKVLAQGTDWRFLNELKKELKG